MHADYDQSLLKGADQKPLVNYGGIHPEKWSVLPLLEQFLINDTLMKYAGSTDKNHHPITKSKSEKYRSGNMKSALLFMKLPNTLADYVREYVIRRHIEHKVLFHPVLLPTVLNDKKAWAQYIDILPQVMRERAWWLSGQQPKWQWWRESVSKSTWATTGNEHRYYFLSILVRHSPALAAQLVQDTIREESPEAISNILYIIGRRPSAVYQNILTEIATSATDKNREIARALVSTLPESELSELLKYNASAGLKNIDQLLAVNWSADPLLEKYYQGQKKGGIPAEMLMSRSYHQLFFGSVNEECRLGKGVLRLKNGLTIANWLFKKYLITEDWNTLAVYYSDLMASGSAFAIQTETAEMILALEKSLYNRMWSEIKSVSQSAVWHLTFAVYSMGIIPLNEENSVNVMDLFTWHSEDFEDYQSFNGAKSVFVNLYFSMYAPQCNQWMRQIESMIYRVKTNYSPIKQTSIATFYTEVEQFRKKFNP